MTTRLDHGWQRSDSRNTTMRHIDIRLVKQYADNIQNRRTKHHIRSHPRRRRGLGHPHQVSDGHIRQSLPTTGSAAITNQRVILGPNNPTANHRSNVHRLQTRRPHRDRALGFSLRRSKSLGPPLARPLRLPLPTRKRRDRTARPHRRLQRYNRSRTTALKHGTRHQRAPDSIPSPHSRSLTGTSQFLLSSLRSLSARHSQDSLRACRAQIFRCERHHASLCL